MKTEHSSWPSEPDKLLYYSPSLSSSIEDSPLVNYFSTGLTLCDDHLKPLMLADKLRIRVSRFQETDVLSTPIDSYLSQRLNDKFRKDPIQSGLAPQLVATPRFHSMSEARYYAPNDQASVAFCRHSFPSPARTCQASDLTGLKCSHFGNRIDTVINLPFEEELCKVMNLKYSNPLDFEHNEILALDSMTYERYVTREIPRHIGDHVHSKHRDCNFRTKSGLCQHYVLEMTDEKSQTQIVLLR